MVDQSSRSALADLPRAVVFVRVIMGGSFRAAAQSLGVSPGTVSHHIKALEESMDVRLIERSTRKMALTSAGRAFYAEVRAALSSWERGLVAAQRFKEAASGRLVVTVPDVCVRSIVVPVVSRLIAENPDVTVDLRVSTTPADLLAEGIHAGLRSGPLPDSAYGSRLVHRGQHAIFASRELLDNWAPKHPSDLSSAPWIHFAPLPRPGRVAAPRRRQPPTLTGPSGQHTLAYSSPMTSDSPQAVVDLALDGLGFTLLPRVLGAGWGATQGLVPVLPDWLGVPIEFHVVTPSPRPSDRKVLRFIELVKAQFAMAERQLQIAEEPP